MKTTLRIEKEFDVKTLHVRANVVYWEDSEVNGVSDEDGTLIPCRDGDLWCPVIDIDSGQIINWKKGTSASIHYKVCDAGLYTLKDEKENIITEIDGYVPTMMSPKENGYGDYIIMDITVDGFIQNWKPDFSSFTEE